MDIGRKANSVEISYRDGKIVKKLSLNLNNEHDAMFYESYQRLPLDNRNYMASLYAREKEHGVNDATGHRLQELALINPKEDTVIMREKRNAELASLNETLAAYEKRIEQLMALKSRGLTATEDAELTELRKKRDELKRRVRNIESSWTKIAAADFISRNNLSGLNPLTKDGLNESLKRVADDMSQNVVRFLEDKFDELPAKADDEDGSEQFVMTNAVYLAALCQLIPMDISKLGDNIKMLYALLKAIKSDTLTDAEYANQYEAAVDYVIDALHKFERLHLADAFVDGRLGVIVEEIKPVAASIEISLSRVVYKTYMDAARLDLPNWNRIKDILDNSNGFMSLMRSGKAQASFRDTDKFKRSKIPFVAIYKGIQSAARKIWEYWNKRKYDAARDSFAPVLKAFNDRTFESNPAYRQDGEHTAPLSLRANYDSKTNALTIMHIDVTDTRLTRPLNGVVFNDWLIKRKEKTGTRGGGKSYYDGTNIRKELFATSAANTVLSELGMDNTGQMPQDVLDALITKGAGIDRYIDDIDESGAAQYRALAAPESEFHNIIDMGNPLKAIRSKYRR